MVVRPTPGEARSAGGACTPVRPFPKLYGQDGGKVQAGGQYCKRSGPKIGHSRAELPDSPEPDGSREAVSRPSSQITVEAAG